MANKKLLLTGACGFVGHHVLEGVLKNTDWDVVILDSLTYAGSLNRVADIESFEENQHRIKFVYHDLKAPVSETTHKMIGDVNYVWHLAAESHVENSLQDATPFAYNVVSTTNLLDYLKNKQGNMERYIGFNTDEVFGPAPSGFYYKETDKFYPSNPYSASKAGQWSMEYAFYKSFRMPITMVHSMNIYGERQHPEKFIPMLVRKILNGEKVTLHGIQETNEISSRCWIHAREVCNGLLFLNKQGKVGETYNVIGEEKDVLSLANLVSQAINRRDLKEDEIEWVNWHFQRPGHDLRYALDGSKMEKYGWKPQFTMDENFGRMIRWMIQSENKRWLNL